VVRPARETLPAMTHITYTYMGDGYEVYVGNLPPRAIAPLNECLEEITQIMIEVQINPWADKGFRANYKNGRAFCGGSSPQVVAEKIYDLFPHYRWRNKLMLKPRTVR
jgi:hypothetical protein